MRPAGPSQPAADFADVQEGAGAQALHSSPWLCPEPPREAGTVQPQHCYSSVCCQLCASRCYTQEKATLIFILNSNALSSTYCFESKQPKLESIYKVETGVVSCLNTLQVV